MIIRVAPLGETKDFTKFNAMGRGEGARMFCWRKRGVVCTEFVHAGRLSLKWRYEPSPGNWTGEVCQNSLPRHVPLLYIHTCMHTYIHTYRQNRHTYIPTLHTYSTYLLTNIQTYIHLFFIFLFFFYFFIFTCNYIDIFICMCKFSLLRAVTSLEWWLVNASKR